MVTEQQQEANQQQQHQQQPQQQQHQQQRQLPPASSTTDPVWAAWLSASLTAVRAARLERVLRPLLPTASPVEALMHRAEHAAWLAGAPSPDAACCLPLHPGQLGAGLSAELVRLTLFSLNDYLGLSVHPRVAAAAAGAAHQVGCGPRSSALVGGFTSEHRQLELELAALKGSADALLFPSGYAANLACLTVLAGSSSAAAPGREQQQSGVWVFSDELNHASLIDGARLAGRGSSNSSSEGAGGTRVAVYRHNDLDHLQSLLAGAPPGARKLVVTDSLFSMDGDFADLQGLAALKRRFGFLLLVDEAHAGLVCGQQGGGAAEMQGVTHEVDVHVGTLSKAAGALGGFVACSSELRALLLNRGRSIIYSTALPVPVVVAARAALQAASSEPWRRQHVWRLVALLSARLGVPATSPIIPLVVGSEEAALALSQHLLSAGYHVPAIRPPTVPAGTCRLRVSLSAAHSIEQVEGLVAAVRAGLAALPGVRLMRLAHLEDSRQLALIEPHMQQARQQLSQQLASQQQAPPPPPQQQQQQPHARL